VQVIKESSGKKFSGIINFFLFLILLIATILIIFLMAPNQILPSFVNQNEPYTLNDYTEKIYSNC
jgi:hypothetical protein